MEFNTYQQKHMNNTSTKYEDSQRTYTKILPIQVYRKFF